MSHASPLLRLLARIAPPGVACSAGEIRDLPASPYPDEEAAVGDVAAARRREFRTGRFHAREALARLSAPPQALPCLPSRAPRWPQGHTGSISHSPALCVAVAAKRGRLTQLGIDIEPLAPISPRLAAVILARGEAGHGLLRTFSAKEAVFKACGTADFRSIHILWSPNDTRFVARIRSDAGSIAGAWSIAQGHIVTLAWSEQERTS